MFDKDLWQEIIGALKKNKVRTLLTAFGVFWGILMLIIMIGAGSGLRNGAFREMGDFATNSFFIWNQRTSIPYKGLPSGRWVQLNNPDIECLRNNVKEIDLMTPNEVVETWNQDNSVVTYGSKSASFEINGHYPEIFKIDPVDVLQGRLLNHIDLIERRKVAIMGKGVIDALFNKGEEPLGKYVRIHGVYYMIVGIFESKHSGGSGEEQNKSVILPFYTMQQTFNYADRVHGFSITAKKGIPASVVQEKVLKLLKQRHDIAPDDVQAFGNYNLEKEMNQMNGLFLAINILIWIVGTGTLLAGIIGVSNIMLVIIRERTREIGIQRSIGAAPFQVIRQIVLESVCLTTIAGYTGLVLGVGIVEVVHYIVINAGGNLGMFANPQINFGAAITALTILIIAGIIAGFIPAKHALKIKPVDALRYE
jgi:putative ABC transport system permease protein